MLYIKNFRPVAHVLVFCGVGLMPFLFIPFQQQGYVFSKIILFSFFLTIPVYFFNLKIAVPKWLVQKKYTQYFIFIIGAFSIYLLLYYFSVDYLFFSEAQEIILRINQSSPKPPMIFPILILLSLSTSLELFMFSEKQRAEKENLLREKAYAELSFLKSQINPHFLFNSLNNIYAFIGNNDQSARKSIELLSNIMRYMLYEAVLEKVVLKNEVQIINDYLDLNKIRLSGKKKINIKFEESVSNDQSEIHPLILITFVENAFKHGISYNKESFVHILLEEANGQLKFEVSNSKLLSESLQKKEPSERVQNIGIGLKNVIKRLDLIYGENYNLSIQDNVHTYKVVLSIDLLPN
ncbi:MAG: histidine kinase [Bacteroidota bacterium]